MSHSATSLPPARLAGLLLCGLLMPSIATAQSSGWADGIFISVNGGYQSSNQILKESWEEQIYGETASFDANREVGSGKLYEVSGGVPVWQNVSAAVGVTILNSSSAGTINGSVPSPLYFNRERTTQSPLPSGLEHRQLGVHLMAVYVYPITETIDVSLFGGPSVFRVSQVLVSGAILDAEKSPFNEISINNVDTTPFQKTGIGGNVGVDVTYMLTDMIGVGGLVRYTRASVSFDDDTVSSSPPVSIDVGGMQVGGGLRLRLPSFF